MSQGGDGLSKAALHVAGCRLEREHVAVGYERVQPSGALWDHSHVDFDRFDALRVQPVEVGSLTHEVFDAAARFIDPTEPTLTNLPKFKPALMQWYRPNAAFERWKYYISSVKPGVYDSDDTFIKAGGSNYRLARVPLAEWSEACEQYRRANYNGVCTVSELYPANPEEAVR